MNCNNDVALQQIVENLEYLDDYCWGNYVIQKTLLGHKLNKAIKDVIIKGSIQCAAEIYIDLINVLFLRDKDKTQKIIHQALN